MLVANNTDLNDRSTTSLAVPKTFHQKFLFSALGHYHVDLDRLVCLLCLDLLCFMHFSLNPVSSMTVVKVAIFLESLLLTRNLSLLVLKIYGKERR